MTFVSTTESTNKSPNLHIGVINMHDLHFSVSVVLVNYNFN